MLANDLQIDSINLNASLTASDKVYDGLTAATATAIVAGLSFQAGSNLSFSPVTDGAHACPDRVKTQRARCWLSGGLARAQLGEILDYIGDRNIVAASELYQNIQAATSALPQHPYLYRFGRVPGTREIVVHPNYLVVLSRSRIVIEILTVLHARRQYP